MPGSRRYQHLPAKAKQPILLRINSWCWRSYGRCLRVGAVVSTDAGGVDVVAGSVVVAYLTEHSAPARYYCSVPPKIIGHSGDLFLLSFVVLPPPGTLRPITTNNTSQVKVISQPSLFCGVYRGKNSASAQLSQPVWSLLFQPWQQFFFWNMYQTR